MCARFPERRGRPTCEVIDFNETAASTRAHLVSNRLHLLNPTIPRATTACAPTAPALARVALILPPRHIAPQATPHGTAAPSLHTRAYGFPHNAPRRTHAPRQRTPTAYSYSLAAMCTDAPQPPRQGSMPKCNHANQSPLRGSVNTAATRHSPRADPTHLSTHGASQQAGLTWVSSNGRDVATWTLNGASEADLQQLRGR